nr:calcium-binding protein [Nocardioides ginsengisegetis]
MAATATCDGLTATIVGSDGPDMIVGTAGDDVIAGLGGGDAIDGLAGDDVICGDDGADQLRGGPGADRLLGGLEDSDPDEHLGGDALFGGPGNDHLDPGYDSSDHPDRDSLRFGDAPRGVTVELGDGVTGSATGLGHDTLVLTGSPLVVGSPHADTFQGSPGRDRIHAAGGSDVIYAGAGDDDIHPDRGTSDQRSADVVQTGAGSDMVTAWSGHDRVLLGSGRDQYVTNGTAGVSVRGQRGNDFLQVAMAPGAFARGDSGTDTLVLLRPDPSGTRPRVVVDAGSGPVAGFEKYWLGASAHWDFRGTAGPDVVQVFDPFGARLTAHTLGGDDYLEGGAEADLLDGGAGHDRALGGQGRDTCVGVERRTSCEVVR